MGKGWRAELSQTHCTRCTNVRTRTRAADEVENSKVSRGDGWADSKMCVLSSCMHACVDLHVHGRLADKGKSRCRPISTSTSTDESTGIPNGRKVLVSDCQDQARDARLGNGHLEARGGRSKRKPALCHAGRLRPWKIQRESQAAGTCLLCWRVWSQVE